MQFDKRNFVMGFSTLLLGIACTANIIASDTTFSIEKATQGWERLKSRLTPSAGVATLTLEVPSNEASRQEQNRVVEKKHIKFWTMKDWTKVMVDVFDGSGKWKARKVYGINPEYAFIAEQRVQNGPYFITECARTKEQMDVVFRSMRLALLCKLQQPFGLDADSDSLLEIVNRNSFKLKSITDRVQDGHQFVEMNFEVLPGTIVSAKEKNLIERVELVLDPANDWRVVKSSTKRDTRDSTIDIAYHDDGSIAESIWRRTRPGPGGVETFKVDSLSRDGASESEFFLPAIGLPDCPGGGTPISRWILFFAVDFLILGAILAFLYRRRQRISTARS